MTFSEDFQRRLRAIAGESDDVEMEIVSEVERAYNTGCDTCGYGGGEDIVEYYVRPTNTNYGGVLFGSMPALLAALDQVPDE